MEGLPRAPKGLPSPVVFTAAEAARIGLEVLPSGRINLVRLPASEPPAPPGSRPDSYRWIDESIRTWADVRRGHIVILRSRRVLWRSARAYQVSAANELNSLMIGAAGIAFQVGGHGALYTAAGRGPEHRVSADEFPELWTRSGRLVTVEGIGQPGGASYLIRAPDGTMVAARHRTGPG